MCCSNNFKLVQVICAIGAFLLLPFILPLLGFTPAGVVLGSFAAWWQSMIGNVAAGSLFSLFQSTSAGVVLGSFAAWWQSTIGNIAAGSLFALLQSAGAGVICTFLTRNIIVGIAVFILVLAILFIRFLM